MKSTENLIVSNMAKTKDLYLNVAIVALLIVVLPYILIAFFSVPAADDFGQAAQSLNLGILGFVKQRYLNWNGRYSSDVVIATYNVVGHRLYPYFLVKFFWIVPLFTILFYFISNYIFISLVTSSNNIKLKLFFSLIILISILINTKVSTTVFWLAGASAYGLANSLFIFSLGIIIYTFYIDDKNNLFVYINLFLIPFINGLCETIMVANTTFIVAICFLNIIMFSKPLNRRFILKNTAYSSVAVISAYIVYSSPGNEVRSSNVSNPDAGNLFLSIKDSFFSVFQNVFNWINPVWFCLLILLIFIFTTVLTIPKNSYIWGNKKIFSIVLYSLWFSLYMSYFVRNYALGNEGPTRANSISYSIFLSITILLSIYLTTNLNFATLLSNKNIDKIFVSVVTTFCFLSVWVYYPYVKYDLLNLSLHQEYFQKIYPLAIKAKSNEDIELPPAPDVKLLRAGGPYLTENKDYWINQGFADYFNINTVIISP